MKFDFSKKNYHLLFDLIAIAEHIIFAPIADKEGVLSNNMPADYRCLINKIRSCAKAIGFSGLLTKNGDDYGTAPSYRSFLCAVHIFPYMDMAAIGMLCHRLAARDLHVDKKDPDDLSKQEFNELKATIESYWEEFATHGFDRIRIDVTASTELH